MKSFLVVLEFELKAYFKNKVYMLTTLVLALILAGILTVPRIVDHFNQGQSGEEVSLYAYYDEAELVSDESILENSFPNSSWIKASSVAELKGMVQDSAVKVGFVIDSPSSFDYYILNTSIFDYSKEQFSAVMKALIQNQWLETHQVDTASYYALENFQVTSHDYVLGKDGANNYFYTYILMMVLYMMVLLYGQNIAVAIASEKSNRAVEILVTSASSYALIFGKIIAGAIAGILQFGILIGVSYGAYYLNSGYWQGQLDFIFHIPTSILTSFAIFGLLGYLFYAFLFGMVGAMAQKTEDINATSMPITIIYVLAFLGTYMAMMMGNELGLKLVSYLPFSSFMGMFSRMAMMDVPLFEVLLSLLIMIASTILVGILASKIYRTGLLMYGNRITFKSIFKQMKNHD